jgi:UDP-N-acetylmuramate dehydrogenase
MRPSKELLQKLSQILPSDAFFPDEVLAPHTTFRIGGPCVAMVLPQSMESVAEVLQLLNETGTSYFVMGGGSNLLVSDRGFDGIIIKTSGLNTLTIEDTKLTAGAGNPLGRIAVAAAKASLSGLEFAHGIPGTVGGGVCMNAGAYGGEMSQVVLESRYATACGELRTLKADEHAFAYRDSFFLQNRDCFLLETVFSLKQGDSEASFAHMRELWEKRKASQPLELPSAGSMFKRPPGHFAGKLIDDCGLRGISEGGAMVSPKHANFIVNTGNATADDVLRLIERVKEAVLSRFGVEMHCEVRRLGF